MTASSEHALRSVSDALLNDLDRLAALEEQKRLMKPEDPRTSELATEVKEIAKRVLSHSEAQEHIAQSALEAAENGTADQPGRSIAETPRAMHAILEDWRAAERRVAAATPGTAEHAASRLEAERLRQEYQSRYAERQREQGGF